MPFEDVNLVVNDWKTTSESMGLNEGLGREKNACHCSFAKLCLTLCNLADCSTPNLPCPSLSPRVCSDSCPVSQ